MGGSRCLGAPRYDPNVGCDRVAERRNNISPLFLRGDKEGFNMNKVYFAWILRRTASQNDVLGGESNHKIYCKIKIFTGAQTAPFPYGEEKHDSK